MARTIVFFTSGRSISRLAGFTVDEVNAKIQPTTPYSTSNGDVVVLLLDGNVGNRTASEEWKSFNTHARIGSLHYVYHTTPLPDDRQAFVAALKDSRRDLIIGPGFEGEHNSDPALRKAYPYQRLAAFMKQGNVTQEDFDDLWRFLNGDPILEELILLLKTHASKKAMGTAIGTLSDLKGAVVPSGDEQVQGNSTTISNEATELVRTRLSNGSGYGALRQALLSAIVEREGANRRK